MNELCSTPVTSMESAPVHGLDSPGPTSAADQRTQQDATVPANAKRAKAKKGAGPVRKLQTAPSGNVNKGASFRGVRQRPWVRL